MPFDVVLLDLIVSHSMGGENAMKRLLEIDPDVIAIVASENYTHTVMSDFMKYGFKGVLDKSYEIDELNDAICKVLEAR